MNVARDLRRRLAPWALLGAAVACAPALAAPTAEQALRCQVAYQLDSAHTQVAARRTADRKGAEAAFERYSQLGRDSDDVAQEIVRHRSNPDLAALPAQLKACDLLFNPAAVDIPTDYGKPPPVKPPTVPAAPTAPAARPPQRDACDVADEQFDGIVRDFERLIDQYTQGAVPRPVPRYQFNTFRDRLRQLEARAAKACPAVRGAVQEILDLTLANIPIE